jgi:G-protein alpha subunit
MSAKLKVKMSSDEVRELVVKYATVNPTRERVTPERAKELSALWMDEGVQRVFEQRDTFFLPGCIDYFFDRLERVASVDCEASTEDILRVRAKATSAIETTFTCEDTRLRMVDVGGQRSERRKRIHCFQDVSALIYVTNNVKAVFAAVKTFLLPQAMADMGF